MAGAARRCAALATAFGCVAGPSAFAQVGEIHASAGPYHTVVVRLDGSVLSWGSDRYGELGLGRAVVVPSPSRVGVLNATRPGSTAPAAGDSHVLALRGDGSLEYTSAGRPR